MPCILKLSVISFVFLSAWFGIVIKSAKTLERDSCPREKQARLINSLAEYDVAFPVELDHAGEFVDHVTKLSAHRRRRRSLNEEHGPITYQLEFQNRTFKLHLRVNDKLFGSNFVIERFKEDGSVQRTNATDNCYLIGETDESEFNVAITDCDGLAGMIDLGEDAIFIEPILNATLITERGWNTMTGRAHLMYRSSSLHGHDKHENAWPIEIPLAPVLHEDGETDLRHEAASKAYVTFVNRANRLVKIYYLEGRQQRFFQTLNKGGETSVNTYVAHKWLAKDKDTNKLLLIEKVRFFSPPAGSTYDRRKRAYITVPSDLRLPPPRSILPPDAHVTFINRMDRFIKLYYTEEGESRFFATVSPKGEYNVNTYAGHEWFAVDYDTGQSIHVNGKYRLKPVRNSIGTSLRVFITVPVGVKFPTKDYPDAVKTEARYIEVMATADTSVVKYHGKDHVEKYVLTLMNIVSRIYQHKSIGVPIYFVVVRLVLLEKDPKEIQVSGHPMKSLNSICYWGHKMRKGTDIMTKNYHDQTVFLTRKDFGPSGYAPVHAMCYRSRSCTLNDDDGFTSSFIIAHETGHTLGMEHDGINNNCTKDVIKGSIMAPLVRSRFNRFFWSACSRGELIRSLRSLWCLKDIPFRNELPYLVKLPGEIYGVDDQCKRDFDSMSTYCISVNRDPCKELWCTRGGSLGSRYCHTKRIPALEGTECATDKWCRLGKCVSKSDNPAVKVPNPRPTERPVDGGWSEWSAFTECSKSCGNGIQSKTRLCNNPEPAFKGKPCVGNFTSYELCNVKDCPGKLFTYHQIRDEQCRRFAPGEAPSKSGANWTLYDFDNTRASCDFDSGLCGWMNDEKDNFDWTRRSGSTPSSRTGPTFDHTQGRGKTGSYLYIETSRPSRRGWRARLTSRVIAMRVVCLRFWFHLKGSDMHMGELALIIKPLGVGAKEKKIWSVDKHRGDVWTLNAATVYSLLPYQIIIQGTRGDGYLGDIAIDDVTLNPASCRQHVRPTKEQNRIRLNPCIALCEPRLQGRIQSGAVVLRLENGTSCHENPSLFDTCVQGKCLKVSCDGVVGSPKILDKCGVCDGWNDTCKFTTGTLNIVSNEDLQLIFSYPAGSTNIKVEKFSDMRNYLVPTATTSGQAYFNGDGVPVESGVYYIAGAKFIYIREVNREVLEGLGPTKERFDLRLKKVEGAGETNVKYEFFQTLTAAKTYFWKADLWSQCSKTCGKDGVQSRIFKCYRELDGEPVPRGLCETKEIPSNSTRSCDMEPCERNSWNSSDWTPCSTSCGPGTQNRQLHCVRLSSGERVGPNNCSDNRPEEKRECMLNPCYSWNTTQWSSCPERCGGGWQTRKVLCINMVTGLSVSFIFCGKRRPEIGKRCNEISCYSWRTTDFTKCSRTCGGGIQYREVDCQSNKYSNTIGLVSSTYCSGKHPPRIRPCNQHPCFRWNMTEWSNCSVHCGAGVQTRTVQCIDLFHNHPVTSSACGRRSPVERRSCIDRPCNTWNTTNWTNCPVQCGGGIQTREVNCRKESNGRILASSYCGHNRPDRRRRCNAKPCYYWEISEWSNCSSSCGGGLQTRQADCKMNSTGDNVYSGYCRGARPIDTRRCNKVPCPADWVVGNWSKCARMCGRSVRTRVVSCTDTRGKRSVFCDLGARPRSSTPCDLKPCPTELPSIFYDLSCNFEEGLCQWKNVPNNYDHFDWERWKGDTPSRKTGPKSDHTLGSTEGYYVYIEASKPRNRDDRARLISPFIEARMVCLDFWYNLFGKNMGLLKVYMVFSPNTRGHRVWYRSGELGQEWHNAKLSISASKPYQLVFEGVRGRGYAGDMAIDDIKAYTGHCSKVPPRRQDTSCKGDASKYCDAAVRLGWCSSKRWKATCCKSCRSFIERRAGS